MGHALRKWKNKGREKEAAVAPAYALRQSWEISANALGATFASLYPESELLRRGPLKLPVWYFLQNWQWYIRGHWRQALVAVAAYAVTFFIWTRVAQP